jgi:hypothetical protein
MLTAKEFNQLIAILPKLEEFARSQKLTSMSLVKTPEPERAEVDLYMCYTHAGDEHSFGKMAVIGRLFSQLWGLDRLSDIVDAQDKKQFNQVKFDQQLKPSEIFLLNTNSNGIIETVTPEQIAEYAKRIFNIICNPTVALPPKRSDINKKRKITEEKKDSEETVSISKINIFSRASSETPVKKTKEEIEKPSKDLSKEMFSSRRIKGS